jgi:UDP-glucuronate 4-epimerase
MKTALVTGSAGFIGYFVCKLLLDEGWQVIGLDCISNYYSVELKRHREKILKTNRNYRSIHSQVEGPNVLMEIFKVERPEIVIHLAAQAGVRHSIENPRTYFESNMAGTFELLEAARAYPPKHILIASTSSVYGANTKIPYSEIDKADHQISFYAATKKSTENMAHSYSHLFNLPITMFRFFTVYGPWGRPDMALFKFTKAILGGEPIDIYNHGNMHRDFTYIDDLVHAIRLLIDVVPARYSESSLVEGDSLSHIAPFRTVNIGNSNTVKLNDFITSLENILGKNAQRNLMPMQAGDVETTWADSSLLRNLTGYTPQTTLENGIKSFVEWYLDYYKIK